MKPEQVKVIATLADGSVAIIAYVTKSFNPDGSIQFERDPTPENISLEIGRIEAGASVVIVSWRMAGDGEEPPDRDYRDAWVDTGRGIGHDMVKARRVHREHLRREREPKLAALDVEYQRADERGDPSEKHRIAAAKQALRDVTTDPRIDAATTIDALRALRKQRQA